MFQNALKLRTAGRGFVEVTEEVADVVSASRIMRGLCNVFITHTSASLLITENADPAVRRDLETFMQRIAPDGTAHYEHDAEGHDDMPAHIRSVLTCTTLTVPVAESKLLLGTWQGIYLWEHRTASHTREIIVSVLGSQ